MQLLVEPIWPWPIVVLVTIALIGLVLGATRAAAAALSPGFRRLLLTLKLLAVATLTVAMLRPALQFTEQTEHSVQLLVAIDASRSMNTADAAGGLTRYRALREDLARTQAKWEALGRRNEVRWFQFSRELAPFDSKQDSGTGDQTAIGQALSELAREARQRRTLGVLLLSDGAQRALPRAGGDPQADDPLVGARKLAEEQAAVYAVGYGNPNVSAAGIDLALEDLVIDPVVFEKKLVPVNAKLRASGANGKKVTVRLLIEQRTGKQLGQSGELVVVNDPAPAKPRWEQEIRREVDTIPLELSFVPQLPGEYKLAMEVVPQEGELQTRNNRLETIFTVRQGGLSVAYFDIVRPEVKSLNMVNGAEKIQLDFHEIRAGRFAKQGKLDPAWFQRGRYNVYIIGDVAAEQIPNDLQSRLVERLDEGAGLLMTGGLRNFSAGGYAKSRLAEFLPVALDPSEYLGPGQLNPRSQLTGRITMVPTNLGLRRYVMQLDTPEKNKARWQALAPLNGATRLKPKNELVEVWAESTDGAPLLCAAEVGRARVAAFAGDTTLQWKLHDQEEAHQRFWRQLILWLARKDADNDQAIWGRVEPRNYAPGAPVQIQFGARGADGLPVTDAEFQVEVTAPDQTRTSLTPRKLGTEFSAEYALTVQPGDYWVRIAAKRNGESLGLPASVRFIVDPRDLELDHPAADFDLLREISAISGGTTLRPEELDGLLDRLLQMKVGDLTSVRVTTLWDNWWLLGIFVGLLTPEWFLRKRAGLV